MDSAVHNLTQLARRVAAAEPRTVVSGMEGSFAALCAARLAAEVPAAARPLVVVVAEEPSALVLAREIDFFLGRAEHDDDPAAPPRVLHLPAVETSPYAEMSPDRRSVMRRLGTLFRLSQGFAGQVLVASATALLRRVIPRDVLGDLSDLLVAESELGREALIGRLQKAGYARAQVVEDEGTYAVRGGVIDLFSPLYRYPARVELFGDLIESIKFFDPQSQRTMRSLPELYLPPVRETVRTAGADIRSRILAAADAAHHPSAKTRALLEQIDSGEEFFGAESLAPAFHARLARVDEYLPPAARWLILDPDGVHRTAGEELDDALERYAARLADHRIALPTEDHYLGTEELRGMMESAPVRVEATALEIHGDEPAVRFVVEPNRNLQHEMARARAEKAEQLLHPLVGALRAAREDGFRVALVTSTLAHGERLRGLLRGYDIDIDLRRISGADGLFDISPHRPTILLGPLEEGFRLAADGLLVVAEEEIFGPRAHREAPAAPRKPPKGFRGLADFSQLQPGDFIVHALNGVGHYKGLTKLPLKGTPIDFLHIQYEGGVLYLPVYRLGEVSRYIGADGAQPRLDRLGGLTWEKTKRKVSAEVRKLAEDLLQLYAQRQALPGHAFPPADDVFHEFEATFPFDETPDQQRAIDEVLADMEKARPMDRLVCGDVGYGKTEVALRAALKAVLGGKQVAVLAPTTVLVEQHAVTFHERFRGWPVKVDSLSRFQTRADQLDVVRRVAQKELDVVIGTHRLLSNDVRFKELGLIIVDEEQRFGVAHKERLKQMRTQVDVLTLTATPIPRTMHMSMMGLREVSIIATPPADRLAVRTFVCRPDDDIIKEGIKKELARGGQVFFVCHRIFEGAPLRSAPRGKLAAGDRTITEWAEHLKELVPGARVAVAHGQMEGESLERTMVDFVDGKHDVLVCTTIVESGLDIPRANTMFIHRADTFGLAQLYQLRGRIGRARERAFCYLMVPPTETLTHEAKQRLQVLQRFTELGAGFLIASHDLEIRGAGDLLGAQQSGQIAAVGFDTYIQILQEAVAELKGEPIRDERDPELNVDLAAYIPDDYVPDTGQRLDLYKRLADTDGEEEVAELLEEIADRFGPVPDEVQLLGELMVVKALGKRLGALSIEIAADKLALALDSQRTPLQPDKLSKLIQKKGSPYRLTPDMRLVRAFSGPEREARLPATRRSLLELAECA